MDLLPDWYIFAQVVDHMRIHLFNCFFFLRNIRKWATSREHIFEPIRIPDERAPADSTLGHKKRKTLKQLNVSWRRGGIKSLNIYRLLVELMMIATDKKEKERCHWFIF
jgi:hypothetical protein